MMIKKHPSKISKILGVLAVLLVFAVLTVPLVIEKSRLSGKETPQPSPDRAVFKGVVESVQYFPGFTIVTMNDGRIRAFQGIARDTFQRGRLNTIVYSINDPTSGIESVTIEPSSPAK